MTIEREHFAQIRQYMPTITDPNTGLDVKIANLLKIREALSNAEFVRIATPLYTKAEEIWKKAQELRSKN
jgi:hypothetical protein